MNDLFDFTPKRQLYAVFGNPIAHSQSPLVHSLFAKQVGIDLEYRAIQVDIGGFEQAVSGFQANGGNGLNVTVPFKLNAWKIADELTDRAQLAGAVNTLFFQDNRIKGDNTDGAGLVKDIELNLNVALTESKILVIGAGGAVRGVLAPMLEKQPESITISNRTKGKADALVEMFADYGTVSSTTLEQANLDRYDIVINATSTGIHGEVPSVSPQVFRGVSLVYDMMYGKNPTKFMQWAGQNSGAQISDGLGMLIEQAAESFKIWHGVMPQTSAVIGAVRSKL